MKFLYTFLTSAAIASIAYAATLKGYVSINTNFYRMQSNADADFNNGVYRVVYESGSFGLTAPNFKFLNTFTMNLQNINTGTGGWNNASINMQNVATWMTVVPVPAVATTKSSLQLDSVTGFQAQSKSMAVSYPLIFQKTVLENGTENYDVETLLSSGSNWSGFQGFQQFIDGAQVRSFKNCRTDLDPSLCFIFRVGNQSYALNGTTYLAHSVKVDISAPLIHLQSGAQPGILSVVHYSDSSVSAFRDMHGDVDTTIADAKKRYGTANALCSSDVVVQFDETSDSGYLNWARTATVTTVNGDAQDVSVNAQVHTIASVDAALNASASGINWNAGTALNHMSGSQFVVYTFDVPQNVNLSHIVWDPEVGIAKVNVNNEVIGGLTGGAVAGIVIACIVTVAAVGLLTVYFMRRRSAGKYNLIK